MSEKETIDAEYTEQQSQNEAPREPKKEKKGHPVLRSVLTVVLAGAAGFGGGYMANLNSNSTAINITTSNATGTSSTTTVANESSASTVADVAAKAAPSVVEIVVSEETTTYGFLGGTYTSQAAGSGVIITSDGYIITNNHVVEGATDIKVTTYDGTEYSATLVGTDSKSDIAVIKVDAEGLTAATIGDSSKIAVGDTAIVIGNPLGTLGGTVTDGIISAANREITINNESMNLIQTNAAINSGNSGGGLFDGNGNLIGIVNAKDSGTTSSGATIEGLGFAIPINTAMDVAEQLMSSGKVTNRATLGVYLQEVTQSTQRYEAGLYITDIVTGSGAEKAGLKAYDRIIKADGSDISSYSDLSKVMNTKKIGDTIDLTVVRDGQEMNFTVSLTGVLDTSTKKN